MKSPRLILVLSLALVSAGIARADLASVPPRVAATAATTSVDTERGDFNEGRHADDVFWPAASLPDELLTPEAPPAPPRPSAQSLPSAPSSATLCLSAFAGFGVWQLSRSARKIHLGSLPEWYHDGGPAQVGHATPFDLSFNFSAFPVCHFEAPEPAGDRRPVPNWWLRHAPRHPFHSQFTLLTADPRGPPTFSLSD